MFLALNLSARVKSIVALSFGAGVLLLSVSSWAAPPYSQSEFSSVESSDESKIRELRNEEITQLRIALGRRNPTNRRADLYYRLAELYLEAYRAQFLLEGRVHERRLRSGVSDKYINRASSKPYISSGITACKEILGFRIPFDKLDQIYYFLGFYFGEMDNRAESAKYFKQLVDHYPRSPYAGPATKELGVYALGKSQFREAIQYLESALRQVPSEMRPPIRHKLAWAYFRVRQFDRAISMMKEAIASCDQHPEKFLPLKEESLRDMAVLMVERGGVNEVVQYFEKETEDKTLLPKILERLGAQYERNVEKAKAITVYEILLKTHPDSDSAFRVLAKLVELEIKQGKHKEAIARLQTLKPALAGIEDGEAHTAYQFLKVLVRKTATDYHQAYRKKQLRADLLAAEIYYTAYLRTFLKGEEPLRETPEIQMYLAEVKRDLGKSREVAELYREVVASKDKRYSKEAGSLWTASLADAMKKTPSGKTESPSELEKEFVEASDLMASTLGDTNAARESALRAAQVLAGYRSSKPEAIKRLQSLIAQWPASKQALTAAQLWIQLNTESGGTGESEEMSAMIHEIRSHPELLQSDRTINKGKLKAFLEHYETQGKVKTIAKFEKDHNHLAAAKGYEEYAASVQEKDLAEKAYTNAISSYLKAGGSWDSIQLLMSTWEKRFPGSSKILDSLRITATQALIQGEFQLSAQLFHRLGVQHHEADSLETSARIYEGIGDSQSAQSEWTRFLSSFRDSPNRWKVALSLARSQEESHLDAEARRSYQLCAGGANFYAECTSRLADLYLRNRDLDRARQLYHEVANSLKRGKAAHSDFVGYATYKIAEMSENEKTFEPLMMPEAKLQRALANRLAFLEPLSRSYQAVVKAGGVWGIAALHRLALFVLHFADEVDEISLPASEQSSNPAAQEKFKKNLATVSGPLREKARLAWNEAYTKAVGYSLLSPVLPEIGDHLADFRMEVPGRAQGVRGKFHLAGIATDGGSEGKTAAYQRVRSNLVQNAQDASAWIDYGNLLWGDEKPLMAKLAYERALGLKAKRAMALNNLAVVKITSDGEENWIAVSEGGHYLEESLRSDDMFLSAKMNLATLMNYYRLFAKAKGLWDQVLVRNSSKEAWSGLAISLQGLGKFNAAENAFQKAADAGASTSDFVEIYHQAGRVSGLIPVGSSECVSILTKLPPSAMVGFEKTAADHLRGKCEQWKQKN